MNTVRGAEESTPEEARFEGSAVWMVDISETTISMDEREEQLNNSRAVAVQATVT